MKVGIVGASGYTGVELVRILSKHPKVFIEVVTSENFAGHALNEIYPHLDSFGNLLLEKFDCDKVLEKCEVIFLALPHGYSSGPVAKGFAQGKLVIDLGADFRLKKLDNYTHWYKTEHKAPQLLSEAVYGLPELYKKQIMNARIIANPGCYPTSALIALLPLLSSRLIENNGIIIDSKSAVSGAGRKTTPATHFNSCSDNINPYAVAEHRHSPEIEQELSSVAGQEVTVTFTPQLIPINRGILSTCYVKMQSDISEVDIRTLYNQYYKDSPFVKLLPSGVWPHTKWVAGTNNCLLNFVLDKKNNRLVIASVIDNLVKGASGQAVQNMNIALGMSETLGLTDLALYP